MPIHETNWQECMQVCAASDIGMRRANNQDSHAEVMAADLKSWQERGHVFVVADGMGAHAAGELASKMASDTVPHFYHKHQDLPAPEAILAAVRDSNAKINQRGEANAEFRSMGTTCSVLLLLPQGALVAHVGDSRIYRLRGRTLQQLTFDHSLVWEMRAAGQISAADDQYLSIPKNVITRSLGPNPSVQVDLEGPFPLEEGDIFLLCSDGLTGRVHDDEIAGILAYLQPDEATRMLINLTNIRGGPDNVTVTIVKITGSALTSRAAAAAPLTVGGEHHVERQVHPAVWVGVCVLSLTAVTMAMLGRLSFSLAAAVGAVIAIVVGIVQKFGLSGRDGVSLSGGRRLGKGPHSRTDVLSEKDLAERLLDESQQWRESAGIAGPTIDKDSGIAECCDQAAQHYARNEHGSALVSLARAAELCMRHIRSHPNPLVQ